MTSYEVLYKSLIFELHHTIGAHFATVEGLFNLSISPDNPDYNHFKNVFEQLKNDKKAISERYYFLEELINKGNADNT